MANYSGIQREETLKSLVHEDFFSKFGYEPNIDNIDFVLTDKKSRDDLFSDGPGSSYHYLWAEAKKGLHDVFDMFTQLILTCKKTYEKADHLAPAWLGVFDEARISFVSFHDILPIFSVTDFNWNTTPSNHESKDFQKAKNTLKNLIGTKIVIYNFISDDKEIKEFIKAHFVKGSTASIKSPINKDNFVQIFMKWIKEVKPYINISKEEWIDFKKKGILDCDFYRADVMSYEGNSITEKLKIVLKNDNYKFLETISGRLFSSDIGFTDNGDGYTRFWNKYERPPAQEYHQFIIDRRDLLIPKNIREVKGSFFTPEACAVKSKEYLSSILGKNWQKDYYIWDCAAGTGNLLAGLTNKYNIWASDIDEGNIETIHSLIDIDDNLDLVSDHVFKFDFLNDSFDDLPEGLREIIKDDKKRKKLIVYINPPYAEATSASTVSGTGQNKAGVATTNKMKDRYQMSIGKAANEIFSLFLARIYHEIPGCTLALFSKVKFINSQNFKTFRTFFKGEYKGGFISKADLFDNVKGQFPIGFSIWDLSGSTFPKSIKFDIFDQKSSKTFYSTTGKSINQWIKQFDTDKKNAIGFVCNPAPDFVKTNQPYITIKEGDRHFNYYGFSKKTIIEGCIYFAVRLCIDPTWINDRDQFLFPNDKYKADKEFQNDCLIFTLFHGQNRVSINEGKNHWIPFTAKDVNAKSNFKSSYMSDYLKGKKLSNEAKNVFNSGKKLWKYYHSKIQNNRTAYLDASFYDIREFFQGRSENGSMKTKSTDETYNILIKTLRHDMLILAKKIQPKVYTYGFLKK